MWSAFPKLFKQVGSLRLVSQEGMEGQQRLNNQISKRSNGWSNAGRIPDAIKELGPIAVAAYLKVRAKLKAKPAEWMHQQQVLHFHAHADETLSAAKELTETEGGVMKWQEEFTPVWQADALFTIGYAIRLALVRKELADKMEARYDVEPYYMRLHAEHKKYYAIDVSKAGLSDEQYLKQRCAARRAWYRNNNTLYKHDFLPEEVPELQRKLVTPRGGVAVFTSEEDMEEE